MSHGGCFLTEERWEFFLTCVFDVLTGFAIMNSHLHLVSLALAYGKVAQYVKRSWQNGFAFP